MSLVPPPKEWTEALARMNAAFSDLTKKIGDATVEFENIQLEHDSPETLEIRAVAADAIAKAKMD